MRTAKDPRSRPSLPPVVQTHPTGPLATRAAQSAPVQRLRALQCKASGPVVQQVLSHNTPIAPQDVASVTQLAPKVFQLTGQGGEQIIIKIENRSLSESKEAFAVRDIHTRDLAKSVLSGVPDGQHATAVDIAILKALKPESVTGDLHALKDTLNVDQAQQDRMLIIKTSKVNVGENVQDGINAAERQITPGAGARGVKRRNNQMEALFGRLTQPGMLRSMGKMAAFDLLVNNHDRFQPEGIVNLRNLDISATEALGIDNLNPYGGRLTKDPNDDFDTGDWLGQAHLESAGAMAQYATTVMADICQHFGKDAAAYMYTVPYFQAGMQEAAQTLRARKDHLRSAAKRGPKGDGRIVPGILADRLKLLPK